MKHIPAGPCPECEHETYLLVFPNNEPKGMDIPVDYHLGERCAITPSFDDLRQTT